MKQHKPGPFYFKLLFFLKLKIGIVFKTLLLKQRKAPPEDQL